MNDKKTWIPIIIYIVLFVALVWSTLYQVGKAGDYRGTIRELEDGNQDLKDQLDISVKGNRILQENNRGLREDNQQLSLNNNKLRANNQRTGQAIAEVFESATTIEQILDVLEFAIYELGKIE